MPNDFVPAVGEGLSESVLREQSAGYLRKPLGVRAAPRGRASSADAAVVAGANVWPDVNSAGESELISLGEQLEAAWAAETAIRKTETVAEGERRAGAACDLAEPIIERIMALKATSPAALRVKARAFMWTQGGNDETPLELRGRDSSEDRTLVALLNDILALSDRSAPPA